MGYSAGPEESAGGTQADEPVTVTGLLNPATMTKTTSIPANHNGILVGPITVASTKSLTIGANSNIRIL